MLVKEQEDAKILEGVHTHTRKNVSEEIAKDTLEANLKKRDINVDLIRVIACLLVIGAHLCLQVLNQCFNRIDWSRLLEKSFFADGVPLFLMITGFFLVNGRNYKKIWKSTTFKVLIPTLIYIVFVQIFCMFIVNKESFVWCLQNAFSNLNIPIILKGILSGDMTQINGLCIHLWYILSYVKIIIWIPVLWLVCKEEKMPKLARRMILIFGVISCIITDIQRFVSIPTIGLIKVFDLVDKEILYVLLGYELFIHKDKIKNNKKLCIVSGLIFVLVNFIRYKIEIKYMVINSFVDIVGRENFIEWKYTVLSIISGVALFIAIYSFELKSETLKNIIVWLGDKTFGIYLIHYLLIAKVDLYKFEKIEKFYYEIIYLAVGLLLTFIASLIIVVTLRKMKELILNLFKRKEAIIKN